MDLKRGIDKAVAAIVADLEKQLKKLEILQIKFNKLLQFLQITTIQLVI